MAFNSLDSIPISPYAIPNSTDYNNQLNLTLMTVGGMQQINSQLTILNTQVQNTPLTLQSLAYILEGYLFTLLIISTITTLDASSTSDYFAKKKEISSGYIMPVDSTYLTNLAYTNYQVWGGLYGTLGYYLYLAQSSTHFSNPSYLIRCAVTQVINSLTSIDNTSLLTSISSDDVADDIAIYNSSISLINQLGLTNSYNYLNFYQTWIPSLLSWYTSYISSPDSSPSSLILAPIAQQLAQLGLFNESVANLPYLFIHQEIDAITLQGLQAINTAVTTAGSPPTTTSQSDTLLTSLLTNIPADIVPAIFTQQSYSLLNLPLPGGFNLWYTTIAAELLNRAYILAYNSNYLNSLISPLDPSAAEDVCRIYKLIFYAGYCLKKCDLSHLNTLGLNLRVLSTLDDNTDLQEYNLLS